MTKTEIKQTAQDYLIQGMENAISMETNDAGDPAVLEAMRWQARRVLAPRFDTAKYGTPNLANATPARSAKAGMPRLPATT